MCPCCVLDTVLVPYLVGRWPFSGMFFVFVLPGLESVLEHGWFWEVEKHAVELLCGPLRGPGFVQIPWET